MRRQSVKRRKSFRISPGQVIPLSFLALILFGTLLLMLPFAAAPGGKHDFVTALSKMESFINTYPGNSAARKEYTFLKSRVQEIESIPEDISQDVWDDIIRQWEEEEAAGTDEEVYEEEYYEEDEGWIYDEVTGEYYDPEELEGVYYGAYTEENY